MKAPWDFFETTLGVTADSADVVPFLWLRTYCQIHPEIRLLHRHPLTQKRHRFAGAPLGTVQLRQVVEAGGGVGMIGT